jgi:hypothetical protein
VTGTTNFRFSGATISLVRALTRESGVSAECACDDADFFDFGLSISEVGEGIDDNRTEIGNRGEKYFSRSPGRVGQNEDQIT